MHGPHVVAVNPVVRMVSTAGGVLGPSHAFTMLYLLSGTRLDWRASLLASNVGALALNWRSATGPTWLQTSDGLFEARKGLPAACQPLACCIHMFALQEQSRNMLALLPFEA